MGKKILFPALIIVLSLFLLFTLSALADTTVYLPMVMQGDTSAATPAATPTATATASPTGTVSPTATATPSTTCTANVYSQSGGTANRTGQTYCTATNDQSAVYVTNGGVFTLSDSTASSSGNTSSNDNSSFYGLNAVVLAKAGGSIHLANVSVSSTGTGANGIFATGSGSAIGAADVTINATGNGGHGVMATAGGELALTDVDMTTAGANSGAIATDRGGGTIIATGGHVTTTGRDSPGIYSTGNISVNNAVITATGSEAAVIEGANFITLTNTALTSTKTDKWGVMIYQSMSGDAEGTEGTFTMSGGSLAHTANDGPLFYVTNSTGIITLNGVDVTAASGVLVKAAAGNWGSSGANGGEVIFTANGQTLTGNMVADSISSISAVLQNGSTLTGALNPANTASLMNLTLDASSGWNVTANSSLTCLSDTDGISGSTITNITGNNHTVYYRSSACAALDGQTYTLNGGGTLQPN